MEKEIEGGMEGLKLDRWGYEVRTSSDSCISAINKFYNQVLSYGRERSVILEAPVHDEHCVLANILAAHFLCSSDPSRAPYHLQAAKSRLEQATKYEKAVFDAVNYLISEDRDDDVAIELHSKLLKDFPRDLVSLKRAQVLCFYMGRPDLSLDLVQQVVEMALNCLYFRVSLLPIFPRISLTSKASRANVIQLVIQVDKPLFGASSFMKVYSKTENTELLLEHATPHVSVCVDKPVLHLLDKLINRAFFPS